LMGGTCADVLMFPSHSGDMQCPRPLSILWEVTARHIERAVRHDDVARQIIVQDLKAALDLWMCSSWQDLVEEESLRTWEETRHNIFLRLAKRGRLCRMRAPDLPEQVFGKPSEEISLMTATRQARREVHLWREMSGDWQQQVDQPNWDLTPGQWWTLGGAQKWMSSRARVFWHQGMRDVHKLAREVIPLTSRPLLSRHLFFTVENMVNSQETSFVQSDEQRSGKQEVRVLAPRLKRTSERERSELQSLLDLTDW
jgi:hypothetical protein